MAGLRITTWNVNGIRNPFGYQPWRDNRTFPAMFDTLEADIVIMQELKIQRKDLTDDMVLLDGWDCFFSLPKHKKGYSGVGIFTHNATCAPIRAEEGVLGVLCPPDSSISYNQQSESKAIGGYPSLSQLADIDVDPLLLDGEGRCVVLEFPAFVLFGVYSPANSNGMRDDYRHGFIKALDARIRNLTRMGKNVILTGDLNVSSNEIDMAGAEDDRRKMGMTHEEFISTPNRRIFNQLLESGDVVGERDEGRENPILSDLCRQFYPDRKGMFTHWEQKINARPGNYGSRIDYILCSIRIKDWFREANIQEGLMGSDHCPVYALINDRVTHQGKETDIRDIINPYGMFRDGKRLRDHDIKDLLPTSGKLLPEFDRRRNIKDMFKRHTSNTWMKPSTAEIPSPSTLAESQETSESQRSIDSASSARVDSTSTQTLESARSLGKPNIISSKRTRSDTDSFPGKRPKTNSTRKDGATVLGSQSSLKNFFKPKYSESKSTMTGDEDRQPIDSKESGAVFHPHMTEVSPSPQKPSFENSGAQIESSHTASIIPDSEEKFIDPFVSKDEWGKLFTKRDPPRCEDHNEPCISLETKKKGFNCGRWFWICPRPVGPTGSTERGTQWRCKTFIWASEVRQNS